MHSSESHRRTFARIVTIAPLILGLATGSIPRVSSADTQPSAADAATARTLFDQAKKLMEKGEYAEACPKLEEGVRLNPGIGMRFNLAVCWEHIGRTASAWSLYLDVAAAAKLAKQTKRENDARDAAAKLEPKLSKLTIEIPDDAKVPGLEVKRNGTVVGEGAVSVAAPVDPGLYAIEATAPDHKTWSTEAKVLPDGDKVVVSVPKLEKVVKPAAPPPPPPPPPAPSGLGTPRIVALVLGGAGVVGIGVGIYFGTRALSRDGESRPHCVGNLCDSEGFALRTDARRSGSASSIAIIAGLIGIGAGVVLWVTAPDSKGDPKSETKAGARVSPWVAHEAGGLSLAGVW